MNGSNSNLEPQEPKALEKFPFLTGVFLDPVTGPFAMSRPVAVLRQTDTNKVTEINESVTEDIYSHNELDARYAQAGWPSPSGLPNKPGDASILGDQPVFGSEIWASRRFMVQRVSVNLAPEDLRPVEPFVEAIEEALGQETRVSQIKALKKVFATWGEVIPLNMVAGAVLATTGALENGATLPDSAPPSNTPIGDRPYNLTDIVDRHLGTSRTFVRRLESRVQGGFSEALLNEGYEGWLKSVTENPTSWRVVRVNRVVPITDILSDKLRNMVERVFGNSLIYRSPSVADPATSRIVEITARAEGSLANLRTTYVSVSGGALVRSETPARGTDLGPLRSMILEDDEYIIQVRGSHNHTWMHQIQFITNKKEYLPFGSDKGDVTFEFKAPKTIDGKDMVLHYMAGKVGGCVHSILFVWAEKPLQATDA
ncbi:hypothetical protein BN14_08848 [Rhizoctonia solani AG-1 IB]|uniref:Jacalin-type lectin domain-containing protein n=1 Tax=Thanatephorus cucumeris (strain AG1-IB / isolate 7/3/14) TaxID=1108050 RepID=M5C5R3_THACB|nr:hypothetical protein BN14_08848 [Rhizoctonia solani AG-1 IB]